MEGLIPYVCRAVTRIKSRRYYENLCPKTSSEASNLDSDKWEGKQNQNQRHRRTMSLPSCLGQHHHIPLSIPAINEEEKEEDMKGCVGGELIIFRKGGTKSLRLPTPDHR